FRCDRDALSEALQTVQRGVSSRPGIPALTGVLIEASSEGALTLTTTDLEVSARLSIDVQVAEPGISLVPARLLADTVKSLSDAPVEFETDQSQARIRCAAREGAPPVPPGRGPPGPAATVGEADRGRGTPVRGGGRTGGQGGVARRGQAGADGDPARGEPRGRDAGRDRLVPARSPRPGGDGRRRGAGATPRPRPHRRRA